MYRLRRQDDRTLVAIRTTFLVILAVSSILAIRAQLVHQKLMIPETAFIVLWLLFLISSRPKQ